MQPLQELCPFQSEVSNLDSGFDLFSEVLKFYVKYVLEEIENKMLRFLSIAVE